MELYKYIDERHITNNKPYKVINNKIIMNKDVCEKYGFHTNMYESLYVKDKFISAKSIISYHIINSLNSLNNSVAKRKKEF